MLLGPVGNSMQSGAACARGKTTFLQRQTKVRCVVVPEPPRRGASQRNSLPPHLVENLVIKERILSASMKPSLASSYQVPLLSVLCLKLLAHAASASTAMLRASLSDPTGSGMQPTHHLPATFLSGVCHPRVAPLVLAR